VTIRIGALLALFVAATVSIALAAGAAAATAVDTPTHTTRGIAADDVRSVPHVPHVRPPARPVPTDPPATGSPVEVASVAPISGIASTYAGTAGWMGEATVALPGELGGAYTGAVQGWVTVCADRCARLPVVDWCQCYWGTADERVVDLSEAAWYLVSDAPRSRGLIEVRLVVEG
jgi:hypothetical protein